MLGISCVFRAETSLSIREASSDPEAGLPDKDLGRARS